MQDHIPDIETNVLLPTSAYEAMPPLSSREEIEMRARTAKLIAEINGQIIEPTPEHRLKAAQLMEDVVANKTPPNLAQYPNETLAYLGGMVAMYDGMVVRELADLKLYVVNKLLQESDNPDGKIRMQALKALGEVDGVDAFKKRTEVTTHIRSTEEVESELLETLNKLKKLTSHQNQPVTDVQVKEIKRVEEEEG